MIKTLSKLLLIGTIVLFINTQRQLNIRSQHQMIQAEVEIALAQQAEAMLAYLDTLPLNANGIFGKSPDLSAVQDIDDMAGVRDTLITDSPWGPMFFEVTAEVRYVRKNDDVFVASTLPTSFRQVTLTFSLLSRGNRLKNTFSKSRIYAQPQEEAHPYLAQASYTF